MTNWLTDAQTARNLSWSDFCCPVGLCWTLFAHHHKSDHHHLPHHHDSHNHHHVIVTTSFIVIITTITSWGPPKTHRYARGNLLFALWALSLSVGPVVFWRLLVRSPAALCLSVPRPLVDYVEQVKRILVLSVRALGLTPLVAVLAGGVVPPAQLYAGAQTLHYGVVQLRYRRASGGGHHRPVADPTGHSSQADTQHGYECPCCRLSRGRFSHARRSPTSLSRLRSTELIMDHRMDMEENKTNGLSYDPMWKGKKRLYCTHKVTWEKDDLASDICWKLFRAVISSNWSGILQWYKRLKKHK